MRPAGEDPADQPGEYPPRPDLNEDPHTGRIHRLDLVDKSDRARDLTGERLSYRVGLRLVRLGGDIRPDRDARLADRNLVQLRAERLDRARNHRAVERARHRDPPGRQPCGRKASDGEVDRARRTGDHGLVRCVVVGDHNVGQLRPSGGQDLLDTPGRGGHRGHRSRVGGRCESVGRAEDGLRPRRTEQQKIINVDGPGRAQGDQLTVAVAAEMVRPDTEPGEDLVHGEPRHPESRLRRTRIGDRRLLGGGIATIEGGRREHRRRPLLTAFEQVTQAWEGHEQIRQHPGPLAALTREEKGDLSATIRTGDSRLGVGAVFGAALGPALGLSRNENPRLRIVLKNPCTSHQVWKIIEGGRDKGHLDGSTASARDRRGQITQLPGLSGALVDPDQFGEFVQSAAGGNPVGAPDDKKLRGPGAQPVGGLGPTVVGGEHHVEVRPAEPERGHTGVPA